MAAVPQPKVEFDTSTSQVSYSVLMPPSEPATDTLTRGGLSVRLVRQGQSTQGPSTGKAFARQVTTVRHGPAAVAGGYEVRRIISASLVSGEINRQEFGAPAMTTEADAESVTNFTVNRSQAYAFGHAQSAQTDSPDVTCASATYTLRRNGVKVVEYTQRMGTGCAAAQDTGPKAGTLAPGTYSLVTKTHAELRLAGAFRALRTMRAAMSTTLKLGTGRVCTNVLRRTGSTITGTGGNNVLCGGPGADVLEGRGGNDLLYGRGGNDVLRPGAGIDQVYAGGGNDVVRGCDNTRDTLQGQTGTDRVYRDPADVISGFERRSSC